MQILKILEFLKKIENFGFFCCMHSMEFFCCMDSMEFLCCMDVHFFWMVYIKFHTKSWVCSSKNGWVMSTYVLFILFYFLCFLHFFKFAFCSKIVETIHTNFRAKSGVCSSKNGKVIALGMKEDISATEGRDVDGGTHFLQVIVQS